MTAAEVAKNQKAKDALEKIGLQLLIYNVQGERRLILIGFINEVVVIGMELQRNAVTQCLISQM